jgi:hypothetical protein
MDSFGSEYDLMGGMLWTPSNRSNSPVPSNHCHKKIKQLYEVVTLSCSTDGPNIYTFLFNQQQETE